MADEEKNESTKETPEETPADEPAAEAAEEAPAEVPAADEAAPEEPQGDDSADEQAAERDAADSGTPAGEAEDVAASGSVAGGDSAEALTPKQQRKLARSQHTGEARPERSPEERASERAAERARLAGNRRRRRATERQEHPAGTGTPRTDREPGSKKVRLGTVVSDKADKTITVQVEVVRRHPVYGKVIRRSNTIHAHDERNEAHEGDVVRVIESRPLSRTKRWRLVEVLERAR